MAFWRKGDPDDSAADPRPPASTGANRRVYAIGDVHGRADLLDRLLGMIAEDDANRPPMPITLILLGDLVDRGPSSREAVDRAIALTGSGGDVRCLKGNHEEAFVLAAQGDKRVIPLFRRMDGAATLASYGLAPDAFDRMKDREIADWMMAHIPPDHVAFLDSLPDSTEVGDYLFVHAGIRPGVALDRQKGEDMRWIRDPFLDSDRAHPRMVVHGHTITRDVDRRANRIGIDTGAFFSGRLTAIGLEEEKSWFIQTPPDRSMG